MTHQTEKVEHICKECAHCVVDYTYVCNCPAFTITDYVTGNKSQPMCSDIRTWDPRCRYYVSKTKE